MYLRRFPDRIINYWEQLKDGQKLPKYASFRSEVINDMWEHCFSLKVVPMGEKNNYTYDYIGQEVMNAYGRDMTEEKIDPHANKGGLEEKMIRDLDKVVETKQPLTDEGIFVNKRDHTIKYRTCILPFGTDKVTNLIAGISWQAVN